MNDQKININFQNIIDSDAEFIPLISTEEDEQMQKENVPEELAILPLRNAVLFPGVVMPITVGRDKSIHLINDANKGDKVIGVISQKNAEMEDPTPGDLNEIGTVARILKKLKMPDGSTTVIIQGKKRFQVKEFTQEEPYFRAKVERLDESVISADLTTKQFALLEAVKDLAKKIIEMHPNLPSEAVGAIKNIESPSFLLNFISSNLNVKPQIKQEVLSIIDFEERAQKVLQLLNDEYQMLELNHEIQSKVRTDLDKQQREYFLQQQIRTIQDELGDNPVEREVQELKEKGKKAKLPKHVDEVFNKELDKLSRMNPAGAEYGVQLNYCQTIVELPWNKFTKDNFDLKRARKILDRDHFGLEKVKERILEHLAVLKLKGDMKSPIICLYGPPGVGKTSLGKSIAESLGREYVRMSLGGMRDEAEIRGHRKTYIGAMPGKVLSNLKKAKSSNPVFVLDEIDKLVSDGHGDPSSALLEVLDPEQNDTFVDNYVELEYDLSKVMFIATANNLGAIQPALRDRMEIINVTGYTTEEKVEIAKKHLLPKEIKDHGLKKNDVKLSKKVIEKVIEEYTRESGVRGLKKRIAKLVRSVAMKVAMEETYDDNIKEGQLVDILGPSHPKDKAIDNKYAGVVTGLAWTPVGGDILFIESSITKGSGKLTLTGNLGDVMKESAVIALEFLKSHADILDLDPRVFGQYNIHIHVPEGAVPKDGPSAGITMLTALSSLFTQRKVRKNLAMSGEITLRGSVLPVGGIKEKILAAKRANIKDIILCAKNEKDVADIEQDYLKGVTFHYVNDMKEVLDIALLDQKVPNAKNIEYTESKK